MVNTIEKIRKMVKDTLGNRYTVSSQKILKKGLMRNTICIHNSDENMSPLIYIDEWLDDIKNNKADENNVAEKVLNLYYSITYEYLEKEIDTNHVTAKDYVLNNVKYKLINKEKNMSNISFFPHREYIDLLVVFYVPVLEKTAEYVVTNNLMDYIGVSVEELDDAAKINTLKEGFVAQPLSELFEECKELDKPRFIVITNFTNFNGANVLLFTEELKKQSEQYQSDLIIIPSSVNEVIIIPYNDVHECDLHIVADMVKIVNETDVEPDEVLSDSLYVYSKEKDEIKIV